MGRLLAALSAFPVAVAMLVLLPASVVLAAPCYGSNNGAYRALSSEPSSKGLQTTADLVAATPANPNTTTIVHPAQIVAASGDFVGWGTAKGDGTHDPDAISNCPTYVGTRWQLYADGLTFDQYFCRQGAYGSEPNTASNQDIEIIHTSCNGATRWAFFWNGAQKTCQAINGVSGEPNIGGESIGADPQHLDIHYKVLKYRILGGTWAAWHSGQITCVSSGYLLTLNGFADVYVKEQ